MSDLRTITERLRDQHCKDMQIGRYSILDENITRARKEREAETKAGATRRFSK